MAKSLKDSLGRRMRAADGSRQLVFGGPEAERQFAEAQLLQQQLQSGNAAQNLAAARSEAAQITQQNLARQLADEQFRQNLAQEAQIEQDRLALDRQRQADQRAQSIGDLRLGAGRLGVDQQRLRNQATQYAQQLAMQERQMDQRDADQAFKQRTEVNRIAESLLSEARGMNLNEEGQRELAKLSSAYRAISAQQGRMRPAQYNSMMQDWLNNMEQANLSQYAERKKPLADRFRDRFDVIDVGGRLFEVFEDDRGGLQYAPVDPEEASTGLPVYGNIQERAAALQQNKRALSDKYNEAVDRIRTRNADKSYIPTKEEIGREMRMLLQEDQDLQDVMRDIAEGREETQTAGVQGMGGYANAAQQEPVSPSDMQYPPLDKPAQGDYYTKRNQDFDSFSRYFTESAKAIANKLSFGKIGDGDHTDAPKMRRLTKPEDVQFYNAGKAQQQAVSEDQVEQVRTIMTDDIPKFVESDRFKQLQEMVTKYGDGFEFKPELLFDANHIAKMVQVGIDDPLDKLAVGLITSLETKQDHIAKSSSRGQRYQQFLAAPIYPRDSFQDKPAEELPLVWYDEFGLMYRRKVKEKESEKGSFKSAPPRMLPLGY